MALKAKRSPRTLSRVTSCRNLSDQPSAAREH